MRAAGTVCLSDLLRLVQQDLEINRRAYAKTFPSQIKPVLLFFNGVSAAAVEFRDIERYKTERISQGAAPKTVNNELDAIRRAYNLGIEAELIWRKPRIRSLFVCNVREGFLEPDQLAAILDRLRPDVRDFAEFAYWTGWRRGEIRDLTWESVSREFVHCAARKSKNRHAKKAALEGPVGAVIRRRRQERVPGSPYVFHRQGRQIRDFRYAWMKAVGAAGFPGLRLHDFRRSFVRNAVRAGIPERVAMELSGHRTRAIFDRYNIVNEDDLRGAGRRLSRWAQSSSCS